MNSSINSSELLTDEEDWAKDSSGTSQLDIIIIIFTSLILGMMILTTIIGKHTLSETIQTLCASISVNKTMATIWSC